MAIGVRRAFPFGLTKMSPTARGPLDTCFRPYCAVVPCAKSAAGMLQVKASNVTAASALRYNGERLGDRKSMQVNDKAPDFNTKDENGKEVALKDLRGKTVVLFFYPKADTPG